MHRIGKRWIYLIVISSILIFLAYQVKLASSISRQIIVWDVSNGQPVSADRFLVILFPVRNSTISAGGPKKDVQSRIERAVLVSLSELTGETVSVFKDSETKIELPTKEFSALPPDDADTFVAGLNAAIKLWQGQTDWLNVSYITRPALNNSISVVLSVKPKRGGTYQYEYDVNTLGDVTPRCLKLMKGQL